MIHLHLTHAEHKALMATLTVSHRKQIDVEIKNRDEKTMSSLSAPANKVLDGAVQFDSHGTVSRVLDSLTIVDEKRKLRFEADSPAHGAAFGNRFIRVNYRVYVPSTVTTWEGEKITGIGDWVPIPIFHGPVSHYARAGVEVTISAQGKEAMMLEPRVVHEGYTLDKGTTFEDAIKKVAKKQGERNGHLDIPNLPGKLQRPRAVHRGAEAWKVIAGDKAVHGFVRKKKVRDKDHQGFHIERTPSHGLVHSIDGHYGAFYNGRGDLVVRKLNKKAAYHFRWGRDFLSRPNLEFDQDAIRNFVRVLGKKQKGKRVEGHAVLHHAHPYSPIKLKWNDTRQYLEHKVVIEHLDTSEKCEKRAKEILKRISQMATDLQFECFPIPLLEEDDWVRVQTPEMNIHLPLREWSIPLTSGDTMTFGRHKKVRPLGRRKKGDWGPERNRHRRRRRHHHHHHRNG